MLRFGGSCRRQTRALNACHSDFRVRLTILFFSPRGLHCLYVVDATGFSFFTFRRYDSDPGAAPSVFMVSRVLVHLSDVLSLPPSPPAPAPAVYTSGVIRWGARRNKKARKQETRAPEEVGPRLRCEQRTGRDFWSVRTLNNNSFFWVRRK